MSKLSEKIERVVVEVQLVGMIPTGALQTILADVRELEEGAWNRHVESYKRGERHGKREAYEFVAKVSVAQHGASSLAAENLRECVNALESEDE